MLSSLTREVLRRLQEREHTFMQSKCVENNPKCCEFEAWKRVMLLYNQLVSAGGQTGSTLMMMMVMMMVVVVVVVIQAPCSPVRGVFLQNQPHRSIFHSSGRFYSIQSYFRLLYFLILFSKTSQKSCGSDIARRFLVIASFSFQSFTILLKYSLCLRLIFDFMKAKESIIAQMNVSMHFRRPCSVFFFPAYSLMLHFFVTPSCDRVKTRIVFLSESSVSPGCLFQMCSSCQAAGPG